MGLQPASFQAPYQPRSGTTCSAIGSAIFWAATNAISSTIPAPFRHHLQHHWKCIFFRHHTNPVQAPLAAPLEVHFLGYNQRHFRCHTSLIQAPLAAPLEMHFLGCNQFHFKCHTSLVQAPLAAPLEVHFLGCNQHHFRRHTSPIHAPFAEPLEVPFFGL